AGQPLTESAAAWSLFLWLYTTTTLMSWTMLGLGKLWEGVAGDQVLRRFVMLAVGLAAGATAWALQAGLMIDLTPADLEHAALGNAMSESWYLSEGAPRLGAYLAYFAGLMVVPRWWLQVDPLRKS